MVIKIAYRQLVSLFVLSAIYLSATFANRMSVRPSLCPWHSWVAPKRFKLLKFALHHTIDNVSSF